MKRRWVSSTLKKCCARAKKVVVGRVEAEHAVCGITEQGFFAIKMLIKRRAGNAGGFQQLADGDFFKRTAYEQFLKGEGKKVFAGLLFQGKRASMLHQMNIS